MRDPHIDKLIQDLKNKKFQEGEGKRLTDTFGENLKGQFGPILEGMGKEITKNIKDSLSGLKMPDMPSMPEYKQQEIPAPVVNVEAPIVNIPAPVVHVPAPIVNIPEAKYPTFPDFPSEMSLKAGSKPFPVIMMDQGGKPMLFPTTGSAGPGFPMQVLDQTNNALRVSVSSSNNSTQVIDSSGTPVGTVANPLNVAITSGAASSTKAQIGNSDGDFSAANPLNVVFSATSSTASALVDSSGVQYSGSNPVPVSNIGLPVDNGDSATAQRVVIAGNSSASVAASQVGTWNIATLTGITNSVAINLSDSSGVGYSGSNPFPVTLISGTISSTKAQIGNSDGDFTQANPLPVVFSSSGSTASALIDSSGVQYSGSNPLPVTFTGSSSTSVSLVNSDGTYYNSANPFFVATGAVGLNETNSSVLRTVLMTDSVASVNVISSVALVVTSVTNTIAAANVDSSGVQYSGSNPFPFTVVTSATATINTALTDSGGVQYSGSNPVPVTLVTSVTQNTNLVGGGNDSIFTWMARTTLPTAVTDGADVRPKADKLGRILTRPIQVRDLIVTAYATLSTQAETTVLAAAAGNFQDLIMITATNGSAAAWKVDIRAVTGGNIIHTMNIPANTGPVGFAPSVPWPQDATGNNWTATISSGTDVSNANVFISGLFSKEI